MVYFSLGELAGCQYVFLKNHNVDVLCSSAFAAWLLAAFHDMVNVFHMQNNPMLPIFVYADDRLGTRLRFRKQKERIDRTTSIIA